MKIMCQKLFFSLLAAAVMPVLAETSRTLYHCDMSKNNKEWGYSLPDGTAVAPAVIAADKGCDLITKVLYPDWVNCVATLNTSLDLYSWKIAPENALTGTSGAFVDGGGAVTLHEGGFSVDAANIAVHFGSKSHASRIKLAASQTWKGPQSGSAWAQFSVGSTFYYNGYYWDAVVAAKDEMAWTIDGRLKLILTGGNSLSGVDVTVNPSARLILVEKWNDQTFGGKLGAKSLTLKGGDTSSIAQLTVGAKNPDTWMGVTYAPSTFDDATLSPLVRLVDGASIAGGTVDYAVSRLEVSGGDSVFSGDVTVSKRVAVDIAEGATFAFAKKPAFADSAAIVLSGKGGFRYPTDEIDFPVEGDGTIVCNPAGGETVLRTDLSAFTGTLRVDSGVLLVHRDAKLNPSVQIVTAEGVAWRYLEERDFGDFIIDGQSYYRDRNGVLHQYLYMNDISKNIAFGSATFRTSPAVEESVPWKNGSVLVFDRKMDGGFGNEASAGELSMGGIIVDESAYLTAQCLNHFDGNGDMTLGERGIEFRRGGMTLEIFKAGGRFMLSHDQTWRGPDAQVLSSPSRVDVGGNGSYMYPTGSMTPLKDDFKWTIAGNLAVYMYYPSNDLSRTDVTVKSPARLVFSYPGGSSSYAQPGNTHPWCGRLNARSLTLDGPEAGLLVDYAAKFPSVSAEKFAKTVILKDGAVLRFNSDSSTMMQLRGDLTVKAGAGTGYLEGKYRLMDEVAHLAADEGAVLDITGAELSVKPGVKAGFSVTGEGTLRLSFDNLDKLAGPLTIDGASIEVVGSGAWTDSLARASGFTVVSDDAVSISAAALEGYAGTTVNVASGVLILDSVASLPSGVKVETSGDGALMLLDPEGFDPEVHMEGTKNVATDMSMIVSETPRENEAVNLGDGDILHVFGSGLKASSSLTMGTGSKVFFHRSATISAPVSVVGSAKFATVGDSVEGVFAGELTKSAAASLAVSTDGGIVFSGGVTMEPSDNAFTLQKGSVTFSDKLVSISSLVKLQAGTLIITNCAFYSYARGWHVGDGSQTDNVLCEVAANATWYVGNNSIIYIGGRNDAESRLRINGGTMWHQTYDTIRLDNDGTGNAVFELASGTLSSQRRILVGLKANSTSGSAKFIWKGGTWKTGGSYPYKYDFLFGPKDANNVYGGLEFSVEGENCVFDLAGFEKPQNISNFLNLASSKMTGKPGAKLKLKGHPTIGSKMVLLDFEPNGMALDLNENPRVDVDVVGSGSPIHLGWAVPGTNGTVACIGTSSPLVVDYVVADGGTFRNSFVGDHWHSGFSSVTVSNLVFGVGSTYMLEPTAEGLETLSIAGSLYLPPAMKYAVNRTLAPAPVAEGAVLVDSAVGVVDESVWTAAGGISKHDSSVYASEGKLLFNYKPSAIILFVR